MWPWAGDSLSLCHGDCEINRQVNVRWLLWCINSTVTILLKVPREDVGLRQALHVTHETETK